MRPVFPGPILLIALLGPAPIPAVEVAEGQEPGYAFIHDEGRLWKGENAAHRMEVTISEEEIRIRPRHPGQQVWAWGVSPARNGEEGEAHTRGTPSLLVREDRAVYERGPLTEWFRNGPKGLEHGLEITSAGWASPLRLDFTLSGSLTPKVSEDGQTLFFRDASGLTLLTYRDLHALDSEGREVKVRWERIEHEEDTGSVLRLILHSADHTFPLRLLGRLATPKSASIGSVLVQNANVAAILSAPTNDFCAGAQVVPGAGPFPYLSSSVDITEATGTGDPPSPSCQANVSHSVWFAFTPANTAGYTFTVCSDAPTTTTVEDTVLALYSATSACTGLAEVGGGCDDDTCGPMALQSEIRNLSLTAGTTYYVVAWSYGSTAPPAGAGALQLRVVEEPPPGPAPPNDRCEGAETIPGDGPFPYLTSVTADISNATTSGDPPAPSCQPGVSRSIWYAFTPASSGRYTFSVCADAPTDSTLDDTVLGVFTAAATCFGFLEVPGGCDDDSCLSETGQSQLSGIGLTAGTRYYIVVWEYGHATPTPGNTAVQVRVNRVATPLNDTCASAATLPLDRSLAGTTVDAVDDTRLPTGSTCFGGIAQVPSAATGRDVAYRFTAPDSGAYSFRVSASGGNAVLYVAYDCPTGIAPSTVQQCLGAANRTSASPEEESCLSLLAGQVVYVYVDEDTITPGNEFKIEANRCAMEKEPNGTPATAGTPACPTEGSIAPAGDVDFFALGIPTSGSRVFAIVDGSAGNSTDFDLRVTTDTDTLEYDDTNNDVPFGSASPNISGAGMNGSASYLRVSHYSPVAQAEPYRLYASVQPPDLRATPESEPNDTILSATGGTSGYFSGALSSAGDVDLFSFNAVIGDLVQIGLDLDPRRDGTPFNGSLALLQASGSTLLLTSDPSSGASNLSGAGSLTSTTPFAPGEAMIYRAPNTGTFYVRVAWSSGTPGDYLLSISRNCRVEDGDGDGVPDVSDCAPADSAVWSIPGEATGLAFAAASSTQIRWIAPSSPGGIAVAFDVLRSTAPSDFQGSTCLATNLTNTYAADSDVPGRVFYYVVRSENVCGGNLGVRSDGTPRTGSSCP